MANNPYYSHHDVVEFEYLLDQLENEEEAIYFYLDVDWAFSKYDPGVLSGPPEACYPPEGGECEECVITMPDGEKVDGRELIESVLGENVYEILEQDAFEEAYDRWAAKLEDSY